MAGYVAPLGYAASETSAKPTRHRALRRESQQFGRLRQRPIAVFDQPRDKICTLRIENCGEACAAVQQIPMDGAPGARQIFGNPFDRAISTWQQRADQFADLVVPAFGPVIERRHTALQVASDQGMRRRNCMLHVVGGAKDRVAVRIESDIAAEEIPIIFAIARRSMHEMHVERPPIGVEQRADQLADLVVPAFGSVIERRHT